MQWRGRRHQRLPPLPAYVRAAWNRKYDTTYDWSSKITICKCATTASGHRQQLPPPVRSRIPRQTRHPRPSPCCPLPSRRTAAAAAAAAVRAGTPQGADEAAGGARLSEEGPHEALALDGARRQRDEVGRRAALRDQLVERLPTQLRAAAAAAAAAASAAARLAMRLLSAARGTRT